MALRKAVGRLYSRLGRAPTAPVASARAYRDPPGPESTAHGNEGERQAKPDEELYGRPDRDPGPQSLTQEAVSKAGMAPQAEPVARPDAYPLQNDPSVAGTQAGPSEVAPLPQDESSGPKAAGQEQINRGEFVSKDGRGGGSKGGQAGGVSSQ